MRVNRAFAAPAAVAMTAVMLSAAVAPAVAKDGDVTAFRQLQPQRHLEGQGQP